MLVSKHVGRLQCAGSSLQLKLNILCMTGDTHQDIVVACVKVTFLGFQNHAVLVEPYLCDLVLIVCEFLINCG